MRLSFCVRLRLAGEQLGFCPSCGERTWSLCPRCSERPPLISRVDELPVVALASHEGYLAESIRRLKYAEATHAAFPLGYLLGHSVLRAEATTHFGRAATLVPVPLHPTRLVERGYNQAALLARGIAAATGARLDVDCLRRVRATDAQAKLDERGRAENAERAFSVRPAAPRAVVLVDDVCTTGATLRAAARALEAGGHRVLGALTVSLSSRRALEAQRLTV